MDDLILSYDALTSKLNQNNILADAAEVHGIICGMLCGGMSFEDLEWISALEDCIGNEEEFSSDLKQFLTHFFKLSSMQLIEPDFAFTLCLPDDAAPINDRGAGLMQWVQGFMLGFGLHQSDLTLCSDDVKEALNDFSEIARMDEQMEEDEESEAALEEVIEYVRVSSMLCFGELGKPPEQNPQESSRLH